VWYHALSRVLRKIYRWLPYEIDKITLDRLVQIAKDLEEDEEKKDISVDEDDIA
jgi:hypothetical protein